MVNRAVSDPVKGMLVKRRLSVYYKLLNSFSAGPAREQHPHPRPPERDPLSHQIFIKISLPEPPSVTPLLECLENQSSHFICLNVM